MTPPLLSLPRRKSRPHVGEPAPAFTLPDGEGRLHRLSDYSGSWLVLYFYPRDHTPGCTQEACTFRASHTEIQDRGAQVLGISTDPPNRHRRFAARYHLPFPLLSDTDGSVAHAYGALLRIGPLRFARRQTFIITPDGQIAWIRRRVSPKHHGAEVNDALEALQAKG